jgi:hypothetical protein
MKIVNPIYDQAFKYLMENEQFAKRLLSIILDTEVVDVQQQHQEIVVPNELRNMSLYRLDFRAIIREKDGNTKTVLIELQKSKHSTDLVRFRNYLAANYHVKSHERAEEPAVIYEKFYPIITVYLLGYRMDDLPYMAVKVDREVINLANKQKVESKNFFIEYLTHQSYIVQLSRLPEKPVTKLDHLVSLFNQKWMTDEGFALNLPEVPEGFSDLVSYMQQPLLDDEFRRRLDFENEADVWFWEYDMRYKELSEKMEEKTMKLQDAEKRIEDSEKKLEDSEKKLEDSEKKLEDSEKKLEDSEKKLEDAENQKNQLARKLAVSMKLQGLAIETIIQETGLSREDIEAM